MRPYKIALFLLLIIVGIGVVCHFYPEKGVRIGAVIVRMPRWNLCPTDSCSQDTLIMPLLHDTIRIDTIPVDTMPIDTFVTESISTDSIQQDTLSRDTLITKIPVTPKKTSVSKPIAKRPSLPTISEEEYNPYLYLQQFYHALDQTDSTALRVVHYGDSQIEGDRMTHILRTYLQECYGGGGVGLVAMMPTVTSLTSNQRLAADNPSNLPRYLAYGPKSKRRPNKQYGPMAQVVLMNDSLCKGSEQLTLQFNSTQKGLGRFFTRVRIVSTEDSIINLHDSVTRYTLHLQGKKEIFGISLETETGVIVDNIAMRGCAGTIFTGIPSKRLQQYFYDTHTRLIILQYGGNVVPYTNSERGIKDYTRRVRNQIRYFRRIAPQADILFVGPSDMLTTQNGQKISYPILPALDKALQHTAYEEQIAYYSLYEAMGGANSMHTWIEKGWASNDGIHFTRNGSNRAGEALIQWILRGKSN